MCSWKTCAAKSVPGGVNQTMSAASEPARAAFVSAWLDRRLDSDIAWGSARGCPRGILRAGGVGPVEPVAQEEVVAVAPNADQTRAGRPGGKQVGSLDERVARVRLDPAGEERRDGEEELVDQAGREERPDRVRPALAEDQLVAARA